jgi:hypothetical protein
MNHSHDACWSATACISDAMSHSSRGVLVSHCLHSPRHQSFPTTCVGQPLLEFPTPSVIPHKTSWSATACILAMSHSPLDMSVIPCLQSCHESFPPRQVGQPLVAFPAPLVGQTQCKTQVLITLGEPHASDRCRHPMNPRLGASQPLLQLSQRHYCDEGP